MVARLINAQAQLNLTRQIFFVRVGGFDLHDNQVTLGNTGSGAHSTLLRDISRSLDGFYRALAQIGAENQVTTFTSSDFGRTYNTNGDGQVIGPITVQKWVGVHIPIDAPNDFVITPLGQSADPAVAQALVAWKAAWKLLFSEEP